MSSVVEVCNGALQKLGAARIVSLNDDSRNARSMNAAHGRIRDRLLRRHAWNFSIKREQLAASATAPPFGKARAFPLPSDYLRLLPPEFPHNVNWRDWQIESGEILTNDAAPLDVRYVRAVTDPNEMDALFRELWSTELALDTCQEITNSNTKKEGLREDKKLILQDAKQVNAFENMPTQPPVDVWITARA